MIVNFCTEYCDIFVYFVSLETKYIKLNSAENNSAKVDIL